MIKQEHCYTCNRGIKSQTCVMWRTFYLWCRRFPSWSEGYIKKGVSLSQHNQHRQIKTANFRSREINLYGSSIVQPMVWIWPLSHSTAIIFCQDRAKQANNHSDPSATNTSKNAHIHTYSTVVIIHTYHTHSGRLACTHAHTQLQTAGPNCKCTNIVCLHDRRRL